MKEGSSIINTTSVVAYQGFATLVDYASTKGAIVGFTRALALQLVSKGIRVNGVAPGPIWTPLQVASLTVEQIVVLGSDSTPMKRAGQPIEVAPSYVFLASNQCSSYITGQVLHPNGHASHTKIMNSSSFFVFSNSFRFHVFRWNHCECIIVGLKDKDILDSLYTGLCDVCLCGLFFFFFFCTHNKLCYEYVMWYCINVYE